MDHKYLNDARQLSTEAFKQATERFLARKRGYCPCPLEYSPVMMRHVVFVHGKDCPKAKEAA